MSKNKSRFFAEYEPVDNTPVDMPTRLRLPQNRTDQIRSFIRAELSRRAEEDGIESFEEADDIEPDDEESMPYSAYELNELGPVETPSPSLQNKGEAEGQPPVDPAASPGGNPAPATPASAGKGADNAS